MFLNYWNLACSIWNLNSVTWKRWKQNLGIKLKPNINKSETDSVGFHVPVGKNERINTEERSMRAQLEKLVQFYHLFNLSSKFDCCMAALPQQTTQQRVGAALLVYPGTTFHSQRCGQWPCSMGSGIFFSHGSAVLKCCGKHVHKVQWKW